MGFTPIPTFPHEGGRGLQGTARMGPRMREDARTGECCRGWDSPPSQPSPPEGGRGLQGTAGMGPRMREDTRTGECCRGWDSPPSQPSPLKGEGVYRGREDGSPHARGHTYGGVLSGMGFTPIPTFPPEGGRGLQGTRGWVPACARTTVTKLS